MARSIAAPRAVAESTRIKEPATKTHPADGEAQTVVVLNAPAG